MLNMIEKSLESNWNRLSIAVILRIASMFKVAIHVCVLVVCNKEIEGCYLLKEYEDYLKSSILILFFLKD